MERWEQREVARIDNRRVTETISRKLSDCETLNVVPNSLRQGFRFCRKECGNRWTGAEQKSCEIPMSDETKQVQKPLTPLIVAFTCVFAVVCVTKVIFYKPSQDKRTLKAWSKQPFTPIDLTPAFKAKIFELPIKSEASLTTAQELGLRQAAYDMTMAFHLNTYEAYRKFRTPVQPKGFVLEKLEADKRVCQQDWKNPDKVVPDDPESLFKRFWEVVYLNKYVNGPVKDSTIGKPFWLGLGLERSEIIVTKSSTRPTVLNACFQEGVGGATLYAPSFIFTNMPDDILNESGTLLSAIVKLFVEHPKPELKCPVYCRLYWDESCGAWLPMEFALPTHITRTRNYVF